MKTVYTSLGFALGASAASLVARDQCCFGLTASGGVSGSVGQLSDGQNRIAQTAGLDNQNGQYCISNGQITDGNGRGCILTPPTTQFQCDQGATPTGGFSVNNGNVEYNGSSQFYACPTGDNGGYNIYTVPVENQQGCVKVTLSTGGKCSGNGAGSSSAPASSAPASSQPASSAPASSAPKSSAPASSAPVSSAPAPSAPKSSAPVSSAPASSAPKSSAPASSAPASSAPAPSAPITQTIYSTHYETITSCGASVTDCPAESTVVHSTVLTTSTASAPASSAPATSAPKSSAPASSAPKSSAPASSAPKSSAPASSAPASSAPASSAPAQSTPAPSATTPTSGTAVCATALTGAYQTPHAIIPVNSGAPDKSYGTQYFAYLGGGNSTIFNFDIPQSYSGKTCQLIFLFPEQKDLETSSFTESGSGGLTFTHLSSAAGLDVSYNSAPKSDAQLGQLSGVKPGNSYAVANAACAAGTTQSIVVSATGDYKLSFFEDWNPSPIGVFLTAC